MAELAIKKAGITDGRWSIGVNFGIHVGNMGTGPGTEVRPSVSTLIDGLSLSRFPDNEAVPPQMEPLIVDAAELTSKE